MKVTLRLFSIAKDLAGFDQREVDLPSGSGAGAVLDVLIEIHPQFAGLRPSLRLAVNREYVPEGHPLHPGDEVAVIPPVSGG